VAIFLFTGWRNPNNKKFNNIDKEFDLCCANGSNFNGNRNKWNVRHRTAGIGSECRHRIDNATINL